MFKQAILLLCIVSSSLALKCYQCKPGDGVISDPKNPKIRNCGKDTKYMSYQECPVGTQYCFKDSLHGNVTLGCAIDNPPGTGVCISRKSKKSSFFKTNRCWCKGNKCNAASSIAASAFIVAALSIKTLLSAKALWTPTSMEASSFIVTFNQSFPVYKWLLNVFFHRRVKKLGKFPSDLKYSLDIMWPLKKDIQF